MQTEIDVPSVFGNLNNFQLNQSSMIDSFFENMLQRPKNTTYLYKIVKWNQNCYREMYLYKIVKWN